MWFWEYLPEYWFLRIFAHPWVENIWFMRIFDFENMCSTLSWEYCKCWSWLLFLSPSPAPWSPLRLLKNYNLNVSSSLNCTIFLMPSWAAETQFWSTPSSWNIWENKIHISLTTERHSMDSFNIATINWIPYHKKYPTTVLKKVFFLIYEILNVTMIIVWILLSWPMK